MKLLLDEIFGRECFLNELVWAYDYGAKPKRRWPAKHDTILVYVRDPGRYLLRLRRRSSASRTWRPGSSRPRRPPAASSRPTSGGTRSSRRPAARRPATRPRSPSGIVRRMLQASTRPGDRVLDPFAGSGHAGGGGGRARPALRPDRRERRGGRRHGAAAGRSRSSTRTPSRVADDRHRREPQEEPVLRRRLGRPKRRGRARRGRPIRRACSGGSRLPSSVTNGRPSSTRSSGSQPSSRSSRSATGSANGITSTGSGARSPSRETSFVSSATTTIRRPADATTFSRRCAPPSPLIRSRCGSISSAPSITTSSSATSSSVRSGIPSSPQRAAVAADVGTPATSCEGARRRAARPAPRASWRPSSRFPARAASPSARTGRRRRRRPRPSEPRGRSRGHRVGDRSGVGERRAAGEPLADVDGRARRRRGPCPRAAGRPARRCRRRRRRPRSGESRAGRRRAGRPWPHRRAGRRRPPRAAADR